MKIIRYGLTFLFAGWCRAKILLRRVFLCSGARLEIYTDSRGCDVTNWVHKRTPAAGYIDDLSHKHRVYYHSCPYKHTTLIDALYHLKFSTIARRADYIILHVGVVDFSPRPYSSAMRLARQKWKKAAALLGEPAMRNYKLRVYDETYKGERTASIYSPEFLAKYLIPLVNSLGPRIIWLGVNQIAQDWSGDYPGERPANMNVIMDYQREIDKIGTIISIHPCSSLVEIKAITTDNVHFNRSGHDLIYKRILAIVEHD